MTQTVLRPDPSRPALRLPLVGLGAAILGGGVAIGFGSRRGIDVLVAATLGFAWLRVWIARAQLVMNADGVGLSVPLSRWHVRWVDLESVGVTSFLTPTHRGGVGAGVRLRLRDASSKSIPDVFPLHRADLARALIAARTAAAAS